MPELENNYGPDRIKEIRRLFKENTADFGKRFNVSAKAVEAWEQGRRRVKGPAQIIYDYLGDVAAHEKGE